MLESIERVTSTREGFLADGDIMVLFTDGIVEARGPDEQFGIPRLMDIVTATHAAPTVEICRHVLEAVQAWAPERQDDQTMVVLRRGPAR